MPSPLIDVHAHAFPAIESVVRALEPVRRNARSWMRPLTDSFHKTQTLLRHLPKPIRLGLDQVTALAPMAGILVESTVDDLLESMEVNEVDQALLIAHPPFISNEFVLEACANDARLVPVVNMPRDTAQPKAALRNFAKKGARGLKIHAASDGEGADSPRYRELLETANELGLFVILHTGCIHSHLIFKKPDLGHAELFTPWFEEFRDLTFILAHMNFHEPQVAMNLVIDHANVHVDTSWQPAETIGEAVRRVGADRVLFGSDWPLVGNNISVGLQRIQDCVDSGLITVEDSKKILGENAVRILKL